MKKALLVGAVLYLFLSISAAAEPFEITFKVQLPQGTDAMHVTGEFPSQAGWLPAPWVQTDNYLTLVNSKFKTVQIFLKRVHPPSESAGMTPKEFVDLCQKKLHLQLLQLQYLDPHVEREEYFSYSSRTQLPFGNNWTVLVL